MALLTTVEDRIEDLCRDFRYYLHYYETERKSHMNKHIFRSEDHISAMRLRNGLEGVSTAIDSDEFVKSIWCTLGAWGMNSKRFRNDRDDRGPKLESLEHFILQFRKHRQEIVDLENCSIMDISGNPQIAGKLRGLIYKLRLSARKRQVVAGSKALHHLLPKVMPPIDTQYTCKFFCVAGADGPVQFGSIIEGYGEIARRIEQDHGEDYLSGLVGKKDWWTSETKLIDNAIIGWVKKRKACLRELRAIAERVAMRGRVDG